MDRDKWLKRERARENKNINDNQDNPDPLNEFSSEISINDMHAQFRNDNTYIALTGIGKVAAAQTDKWN